MGRALVWVLLAVGVAASCGTSTTDSDVVGCPGKAGSECTCGGEPAAPSCDDLTGQACEIGSGGASTGADAGAQVSACKASTTVCCQ